MNRKLLVLLLAVSLTLGLALSASAEDPGGIVVSHSVGGDDGEVYGPYTLTKTAYVVEAGDDALMVYFPSFNFANSGDVARKLQNVPVREGLAITDSGGKSIQPRFVVPGQEIRITFRYQMRATGELVEGNKDAPVRMMEIIEYRKIVLSGETLKLKEGVSIQDLDDSVLVGTILEVSANGMQMYIEGGRMFYGGYEYLVHGQKFISLDENTVFRDSRGLLVPRGDIRPFQRVQVKVSDTDWAESSPPGFGGGRCTSLRVLEYGDKFIGMDAVKQFHRMSCAVIERQKDENGQIRLLVQPDPGSRERGLQPRFMLSYTDGWPVTGFPEYTAGTRIDVSYMAIRFDTNPGVIDYVSEIKANGLPAKTPEQMSETFGKPGDVTLTANPAEVSAGAKAVDCVWKNNTGTELTFGQWYVLEVKNGDKWQKYGLMSRNGDNYAFTSEANILPPQSEVKFSYNLSVYTDRIEAGTYRVKTDFIRSRAPGDYDMYTAYAEFTVK